MLIMLLFTKTKGIQQGPAIVSLFNWHIVQALNCIYHALALECK